MNTNVHLPSHLAKFFLEMFHTNIVEKIKTHILCPVTLYENRAFYGIMWKNVLVSDRPQII